MYEMLTTMALCPRDGVQAGSPAPCLWAVRTWGLRLCPPVLVTQQLLTQSLSWHGWLRRVPSQDFGSCIMICGDITSTQRITHKGMSGCCGFI